MAEYTTDRGITDSSVTIHNVNPVVLMEKILRERIQDALYFKELCFAIDEESICDRAAEDVKYIGGHYGNLKPTPFACLLFSLLQLNPSADIVKEYLNQKHFKYLTALAAIFIRMTFPAVEVYTLLEPFLADYRKLRIKSTAGTKLIYMDEFVDELLIKERVCDIALIRLPKRQFLEDEDKLDPRKSLLDAELDSDISSDDRDYDSISELRKEKEVN
ncbi:PRP38-domain-containing protein [Nadsonia fulvescens var. elongata DSM 6958]|uniref:Pre-mRNA-splicing factor 38 n=1 Tax=Nadsonia fulvescens var. elongata DSM 6958 TaxID=857566 RepID=A0A1E3PMG8_9ASCO|nr:PRP38-domain-containing protein [Nadsonia fulvescens var. elongata DSM 6958]